MKVVIVGSGEMLMSLIAGCEDCASQIVGVLRAERQYLSTFTRFLKDKINPSNEYVYLKSHNLYEINAKSVNSKKFKKEILRLNPDIVIVGSWGEKFKKDIIDLPKLCTINVHPSLLPKYRGPNPYLEVIRHQEKETGVTFHLMNEEYDAGEILSQKTVEIFETDTGKELKTRVTEMARVGIRELLADLNNEIIIPMSQNEAVATYYPQITTKDLLIDFTKSSKEILAHIRSLHPFGKTYFSHNSHFLSPNPYKLEIIENKKNYDVGTIYEVNPKYRIISVVCGDGKVLKMTDVRLFGLLMIISDIYIRLRVKEGKTVF